MTKLVLLAALLAGLWLMLRTRHKAKTPLPLDEIEARAVLGVDAGADAEVIRTAHRRLVSALHPDKGGSAELTRRINAARDVLLKR